MNFCVSSIRHHQWSSPLLDMKINIIIVISIIIISFVFSLSEFSHTEVFILPHMTHMSIHYDHHHHDDHHPHHQHICSSSSSSPLSSLYLSFPIKKFLLTPCFLRHQSPQLCVFNNLSSSSTSPCYRYNHDDFHCNCHHLSKFSLLLAPLSASVMIMIIILIFIIIIISLSLLLLAVIFMIVKNKKDVDHGLNKL